MRLLAAIAVATIAFGTSAGAQDFPTRPMTMVIPFAAGGPTDVLGRVIAEHMSEVLGQQVIVENIGGAGGMTGSERVAKAAPDGYQFVLGTVGTHAQGQTLYRHPLYNAVTDFTPVILVAEVPIVLITRKDLPVNNFQEFVSYCQGEPDAYAIWFRGCWIGHASRLCAPELSHRRRRHTRPLSRDGSSDAGFGGRAHRLSL